MLQNFKPYRPPPRWFKLIAKALGEKASADYREADHIALIRMIIVFVYIITNLFIVAGIIHKW